MKKTILAGLMNKTAVIFSLVLISSSVFASTFDYCTCRTEGNSAKATAYLEGRVLVKNGDGSVSVQTTILEKTYFDGNSYWAMATQYVADVCNGSKKNFVKHKICPVE